MKSPARVAAGRRNRAKWRGFSADGLERLREAACRNQPWGWSTGPRTAAGRQQSARNGARRGRTRLTREYLRLYEWCLRYEDREDGFEFPLRRMALPMGLATADFVILRLSELNTALGTLMETRI